MWLYPNTFFFTCRFFSPEFTSNSRVDRAYQQSNQKEYVSAILGSNDGFIVSDGNNYLARGHLAPDAAFIYDAFQVRIQ